VGTLPGTRCALRLADGGIPGSVDPGAGAPWRLPAVLAMAALVAFWLARKGADIMAAGRSVRPVEPGRRRGARAAGGKAGPRRGLWPAAGRRVAVAGAVRGAAPSAASPHGDDGGRSRAPGDGGTGAGGAPAAAVRISEEVVGAIAGIAASEVDGVAGMSSSGLSEMLGKRGPGKGVRVEVGTREAAIDLFLTVEYGVRIPVVAQRVQERVKRAVEEMTGLRVVEVNVHVQAVSFGGGHASAPRVLE
jgi:uncharacterized alkaline shock family protein YloU